MKNSIWNWFASTFNPQYWVMAHPFSEEWDKKLMRLMDDHDFVLGRVNSIDEKFYEATIGGVELWIQNMPYGAFNPTKLPHGILVRPSRATIHRARSKLAEDRRERGKS